MAPGKKLVILNVWILFREQCMYDSYMLWYLEALGSRSIEEPIHCSLHRIRACDLTSYHQFLTDPPKVVGEDRFRSRGGVC